MSESETYVPSLREQAKAAVANPADLQAFIVKLAGEVDECQGEIDVLVSNSRPEPEPEAEPED